LGLGDPPHPILKPLPAVHLDRFLSGDRDEGGVRIFVHDSTVQTKGFRTLAEKQRVRFEVVQGPKGPQAANINQA